MDAQINYIPPQLPQTNAATECKNTSILNNQDSLALKLHLNTSTSTMSNNNRNSTGSTSSQTSGFESCKSSICHLVNSGSSGSCTSSNILPNISSLSSGISVFESSASHISSAGSDTISRSSIRFDHILDASASTSTDAIKKPCSRVNIREMMSKGIPESEILAEWLQRLCLSDYLMLFLTQGYDLQTIARVTPEDLSALAISRPDDRKRLMNDIKNWNIFDDWPSTARPDSSTREWLSNIGLRQYIDLFECQGYLTMNELDKIDAEDLEDIGVKKLGHIKRICLALKKLKQNRANIPCNNNPEGQMPSTSNSSQVSSSIQPQHPQQAQQQSSEPSMLSKRRNSLPKLLNPRYSMPIMTMLSNVGTLRSKNKPSQVPQFTTAANVMCEEEEPSTGTNSIVLRNTSFGLADSMLDKGPPKLNLFRTSQILSHVPKIPLSAREGIAETRFYEDYGRVPPPPAPTPIYGYLVGSASQPGTPRNLQKVMFGNQGRTETFKPFSIASQEDANLRTQIDALCATVDSIQLPPAPPKRVILLNNKI